MRGKGAQPFGVKVPEHENGINCVHPNSGMLFPLRQKSADFDKSVVFFRLGEKIGVPNHPNISIWTFFSQSLSFLPKRKNTTDLSNSALFCQSGNKNPHVIKHDGFVKVSTFLSEREQHPTCYLGERNLYPFPCSGTLTPTGRNPFPLHWYARNVISPHTSGRNIESFCSSKSTIKN